MFGGAVIFNRLVRDYLFWAAIFAALLFWIGLVIVQPITVNLDDIERRPGRFFLLILLLPIVEELAFRGFLQELLARKLYQRRILTVSYANLLTSFCFVAAHLPFHSVLWSLAVFFPSIIFGIFKDRYHSLIPPILLHIYYNFGYFTLYS